MRMIHYLLFALFTLLCPIAAPLGAASELLKQHDEGSVRRALAEEIPLFPIDSISLISRGWDNLVAEINNEWIFRFPKSLKGLAIIKREELLLEQIRFHVTIQIPYFEYIGFHTGFVGYRKIIGESLHEKNYLNLDGPARQRVAESLALFLTQLHRSVPIKKAKEWGYEEYHTPLAWIEDSLLCTLPSKTVETMIEEALYYARVRQNFLNSDHLVLLHKDLHGENLAFDSNSEAIVGVFDFSDAEIGDYSADLSSLFTIHYDLAIRTSEAYAKLNNVANPLIPAAVDYILKRAVCLLYNREIDDQHEVDRLYRMLKRFVPIWNELLKSEALPQGA